MPSVIRRIFFSNKKKGHHGSKFQEFHGYDDQRFPSYPITQNLNHPQQFQQNPHQLQQHQQQHQHQHQQQHQHHQQQNLFQHSQLYLNQYQHGPPPPHSHRQVQQNQLQPQFQTQTQFSPQNPTIVQSPQHQQIMPTPAPHTTIHSCQCQHCSLPASYAHQGQAAINMTPTQPAIIHPSAPPSQIHMNSSHAQIQSQPLQPGLVSHLNQPQQTQQPLPIAQHEHPIHQQPCLQNIHPQQQNIPQQLNSHCQDMSHHHENQVTDYVQQPAQCTCHHCPNHPNRSVLPQHQQFQQEHVLQHSNQPHQQQFVQPATNPHELAQQMEFMQPSSVCQHQMVTEQMQHSGQNPYQPCGNSYNHIVKNQICSSNDQSSNGPMMMVTSTPRLQQQQEFDQHQQQATQNQQQYKNIGTGSQQFHYHTIQPNQYQLQKQQQQHQNQFIHQRIQSFHQQTSRPPTQLNESQLFHHVIQATTPAQMAYHAPPIQSQTMDPRLHDFSAYANVKSIRDDAQRTNAGQLSKYQEHVYCNQKPELILPPYEPPPGYDTFMENRKSYLIGMSSQHVTHHSESQISQKTKDSSYENLRRISPCCDLEMGGQEPNTS